MPAALDLIGQRFGKLVVLAKHAERNAQRLVMWMCECDCGTETLVATSRLRSHNTKSCGCGKRNANRKHGYAAGATHPRCYEAWRNMNARCYYQGHPSYCWYGARGITVCQSWRDSFEAFLDDMGEPLDGTSLDRIDSNGNYEPENCRWATLREQGRNKRSNRLLTYRGITKPMVDWAEYAAIPYGAFVTRIHHGWSIEAAIETPIKRRTR